MSCQPVPEESFASVTTSGAIVLAGCPVSTYSTILVYCLCRGTRGGYSLYCCSTTDRLQTDRVSFWK